MSHLRRNSLSLLSADKEGGFVVMPADLYKSKALDSVNAVFDLHDAWFVSKAKSAAKKLCKKLNLDNLVRAVGSCTKSCLDIFFTAKTHKNDCPFRVIISENGTYQKTIALFLQEKLALLTVDDPFLVKSSDDVTQFLRDNCN